MATKPKNSASRKSAHALKVLSSLDKMRLEDFTCDFLIKVDSSKFPVHKNVLSACSDYFKAMFSHETKEVQEGVVDMKDVEAETIKKCIQFMYTGEAEVDVGNADQLLHASVLMQLNGLTELCFEHLKSNMTKENCFTVRSLAQTFSNDAAIDSAELFITANFDEVVSTEGFCLLSKPDVSHLILRASDRSSEILWVAVMTWIKHDMEQRKQHFLTLVKALNFGNFPFDTLLTKVWNETLVQGSEECKQMVVTAVFSSKIILLANLDTKNCFVLKKLAKNYELPFEEVDTCLDAFMANHFEVLTKKDEFNEMSSEDMVNLFQSMQSMFWLNRDIDYAKWSAALKWVKHDLDNRKNTFPKLLRYIFFNWLSLDFIEKTVRAEPLVKESHECKDIIMDVLCSRLNESGSTSRGWQGACGGQEKTQIKPRMDLTPYILLLDRKGRCVRGLDTHIRKWREIIKAPQISNTGFSVIVSVNNDLYLMYNKTIYHLERGLIWCEKADMAFRPERGTKVVAFQGCVYVVSTSFLSHYHPNTNNWEEFRQPPDFEGGFCLATTDKYLYAFGGFPYSDRACQYDPTRIHWSDIAPMKYERSAASAAEYNGFIFVLGGRMNEEILRTVECYDPTTNSWTEIAEMSMPRANFCALKLNGKLYAVGGHDSIERLDEEKNTWQYVDSINARPFGISACGFTCWVIKNLNSDGLYNEQVMLL